MKIKHFFSLTSLLLLLNACDENCEAVVLESGITTGANATVSCTSACIFWTENEEMSSYRVYYREITQAQYSARTTVLTSNDNFAESSSSPYTLPTATFQSGKYYAAEIVGISACGVRPLSGSAAPVQFGLN